MAQAFGSVGMSERSVFKKLLPIGQQLDDYISALNMFEETYESKIDDLERKVKELEYKLEDLEDKQVVI